MAKITIAGQAIVVTSSLKLEEIEKVKKYRPSALTLYGGEDGKEPIFALGIGEDSLTTYGASFNKATRDDEKHAVMTLVSNYTGDNVEEMVADKYGAALIDLGKLEAQLPEVLNEIDAERANILSHITVAQ